MRMEVDIRKTLRSRSREFRLDVAFSCDENLNVICGKNALRITRIKPAGSPLMDFKAFTNGRQTQPGDSFAKISE